MAANNFTVDVEARLTVSDDTAKACYRLLDIYCSNRVGDLTAGKETCETCALCDKGYCWKIKQPVF